MFDLNKILIVDYTSFLIHLILAIFLSLIIQVSYTLFSLKKIGQFDLSKSFVLITASTFFVVFLVKSSIALSLGLVGALSIVRFRTPIKDPLELSLIFSCIAIGISLAVNEKYLAIIFTVFSFLFLFITTQFSKNKKIESFFNRSVYFNMIKYQNHYIIEIQSSSIITNQNIYDFFNSLPLQFKIISESLDSNVNYYAISINTKSKKQIYDLMDNLKIKYPQSKIILREEI